MGAKQKLIVLGTDVAFAVSFPKAGTVERFPLLFDRGPWNITARILLCQSKLFQEAFSVFGFKSLGIFFFNCPSVGKEWKEKARYINLTQKIIFSAKEGCS